MLVNLQVVSLDERIDISDNLVLLDTDLWFEQLRLVVLIQVQITLQETMIQIKLCQILELCLVLLAICLNYEV